MSRFRIRCSAVSAVAGRRRRAAAVSVAAYMALALLLAACTPGWDPGGSELVELQVDGQLVADGPDVQSVTLRAGRWVYVWKLASLRRAIPRRTTGCYRVAPGRERARSRGRFRRAVAGGGRRARRSLRAPRCRGRGGDRVSGRRSGRPARRRAR